MSINKFRYLILVAFLVATVLLWNPAKVASQTVTPTITSTQEQTPTFSPNQFSTQGSQLLPIVTTEPTVAPSPTILPSDQSAQSPDLFTNLNSAEEQVTTTETELNSTEITTPGHSSMNLKTNYSFVVSLDYNNAKITAKQTVAIVNKSGDYISYLNFSVLPKTWGEFTLGTVKVDGVNAITGWTNNSNLVVQLGKQVANNAQTNIEINFILSPTNDTSTYLRSSLSKANGIMQVSSWFPIVSNGHGTRMPGDSQYSLTANNFHMNLTLDGNYPVAAPGIITSPTSLTRTVDFGPGRNFVFSVCPNCNLKTGSIDGINVKTYYLSGANGLNALSKAMDALHTFNSKFVNYPYDTFVVAQAAGSKTANEFPGMIFVGSSFLNDIKHETSHQWFYGMLGNDQMNAPWLDEAFAQWAGAGFAAHSYCSTKPVNSSIYDFPNKYDYSNWSSCGSYDQTIYFKGATFIQGVRSRMGDAAFFNSLKNLFANYRFRVITTSIVANNWLNYTPSGNRASLKSYMQSFINW